MALISAGRIIKEFKYGNSGGIGGGNKGFVLCGHVYDSTMAIRIGDCVGVLGDSTTSKDRYKASRIWQKNNHRFNMVYCYDTMLEFLKHVTQKESSPWLSVSHL